ncbi:alpha/beta fold hydrolase [Paenibacillus sp. HJL G12]|uniref:Alpha/beta fold hydrolase n=1 Tax=Paenibacillus dendrobii TaxID=2691084 RepID=A0A7X3LJK0_9BACL|nr:alpha/beta hydrolase [Paenibacillus dendrobii]MWV45623.1 alpha/beta fold hydrolase [Paenibacillus dendrobii]
MEWWIAALAVAAAALAAAGITQYAFVQMTQMKALNHQQTFEALERAGARLREFYDPLPKKDVQITSHDGLRLNGVMVPAEQASEKWVILVHGYTTSLPASIPFMEMFYEDNFNLLLIDQRRHGKSEGKYTTYGYHEKHDVASWIRFITQTFGRDCIIGLHGVSLGGSTVLEYLSLPDPVVKFVIADCPYSDLTRLMHHQMQRLNHIPAAVFLPLVNARLRWKAGFALNQVSPLRTVEGSRVPVMFIHGTKDRYIPPQMSADLFAAKSGHKRLLFVEGAIHGFAIDTNPTLYKSSVKEFVQEALSGESSSRVDSPEPVSEDMWQEQDEYAALNLTEAPHP